jgi:acetyl-CoA C-acetyltransferase
VNAAAIVCAGRRTPIGRVGGALAHVPVERLAAPVLRAVLDGLGARPTDVDDVILGNAAGPGGNPARVASLEAGFDVTTSAVTVDRQCGSGLEAINLAARLVQAGAGDMYLAGGVESPSTAPWTVERPATPQALPRFAARARFAPATIGDPDMGAAAENVVREHGITRERQDRFALRSHEKAVAAAAAGAFDDELVPVSVALEGSAPTAALERDECPRPDTSLERLARLKPVFRTDGTVTAGNACPVNDGAAVVAVLSERRARELGVTRGLRFVDAIAAGVHPDVLGIGPVTATRRLLERNSRVGLGDIGLVEFTEAFAGQVLACLDLLGLGEERVNVSGGTIALGHPWGASGAVLVTRLLTETARTEGGPSAPRYALATLGIAGGMGLATLFEPL